MVAKVVTSPSRPANRHREVFLAAKYLISVAFERRSLAVKVFLAD